MKPGFIGHNLRYIPVLFLAVSLAGAARSQTSGGDHDAHVPVESLRLENGITLLMVPRPEATTVSAGWMVRCGSADDPFDHTGTSHLLEHLLFKGSRRVGTRQPELEEELHEEIDRLWTAEQELRAHLAQDTRKQRGKLERQLSELIADRQAVQQQATQLQLLGEFSLLYSQQGGTGLNANTYRDMTVFFVTLPSEKLELWFWLESDRLMQPVFRQFYKEIQVIREERRLRIESTPTGSLDEEVRHKFWGESHPYAWNPMGRPGDLDSLSRDDAYDFFRRNYRPDRIVLALVGGFDPADVERLARAYFGRWPIPALPPPTSPLAVPTDSIQSFDATCNCPDQLQVIYPSARFDTADAYTLQLLAAVLNGRTGRLYRDFVLQRGIAFSAFVQQISWRLAGEFRFQAESKGGADPAALLAAWDDEVQRLQQSPVDPVEIERARNRLSGDAFRLLKDPTALMKQLLIYEGLGDWRYINRWIDRLDAVTAADLQLAAKHFLDPGARTVAIFRSEVAAGTTRATPAEDPSEDTAEGRERGIARR